MLGSGVARRRGEALLARQLHGARRLGGVVAAWLASRRRVRQSQRALRFLSDEQLADIGLARSEADCCFIELPRA